MKQNFWNNWDLKSILTVGLLVGQFIWFQATINAKVTAIEKQRNTDIETVKSIRESDMNLLNNNINEVKELMKEMRQDLKSKQDK